MDSGRKIAISGANGFVARNLRRLLLKCDIPAVCFARRNFESYRNETKVITADYSAKSVVPKLKGCTAFVHLVGIGRPSDDTDYAINVALTRKIIGCIKRSKIKKIIFNSGLGASSTSGTGYFISKYRAEREITASKLDYTIFRPSYILGRDDHLTKGLKRQLRRGGVIIPGSGKFKMQPIHVGDACKIILQSACSKKYSNHILDLVGPKIITYRQLVSGMGFGKTKKQSLEDAYRLAVTSPNPVFGTDDLNILVGSFVGDFARLRRISGLKFADALQAGSLP